MKVAVGAHADAAVLVSAPPGLEACNTAKVDFAAAQLHHQRLMMHNLLLSQAHAQMQAQMQMQAQLLAYQNAVANLKSLSGTRGVLERCSLASASTASGDTLSEPSDDGFTTVIVKKMPKAFTREMLMSLLDTHGFKGKYDFLYVPVEFERKVSTGCAFINFIDNDSAELFKQRFHGFRKWGVQCGHKKQAEITWSETCQGREAHIERYRNSSVMHESVPDQFKPVLFVNGVRVTFPAPTRALRAPEPRAQI
jgi:hypothetical protein